ncbi:MAG: hypothetical protein J6Y92_04175 [Lentisphaeria bacterium]|nr:hypothetical protein [Lentisphaeria bacterium]
MALKQFLFVSALFAAWAAFFLVSEAGAAESKPNPPRFGKVLVLFSAETSKEDRDAFLDGLEEARLRHQKDYREIVRKWRETPSAERYSEQAVSHNPWFLESVDVQMIRELYNTTSSRAWAWEQLQPLLEKNWPGADALIVVASDGISSALNDIARNGNGNFEKDPERDDMVILFAGVSSFDESVREPRKDGNATGPAIFPNAFAILHPVDPWPNTDLALSVFPKTKKVILLTSGRIWNAEKETAYRAKLGPGKTLKTILIPEIPKRDVTEADIAEMKKAFATSLKAEIQPDTVIVSLSSVEHGQDPVEWLPDSFDACPVFSDTPPVRKNEVGGFCRSMNNLAIQVGDLLEQLSKDSLYLSRKSVPAAIAENDDLWLNEAAQKRYRLNLLADFPENVIVANTTTKNAPQRRVYPTWTKKRIFALLAANAAVLFGLTMLTLLSIRARRRRRVLSEKVYESLPVRVLVTDREGRIIDYHMQFGDVEQKGELLWKNINEVPWLRDIGMDRAVREAFDSGKTIVREFDIDGEPRVVVLARTPSDVFGRAAVVAVSSDSPQNKPQA